MKIRPATEVRDAHRLREHEALQEEFTKIAELIEQSVEYHIFYNPPFLYSEKIKVSLMRFGYKVEEGFDRSGMMQFRIAW